MLEPAGILVAARVDYWTGALLFPHDDWQEGGDELAGVLTQLQLSDRNLLTHSHGLQVAAFAVAQTIINRWLSVAGPVRNDMADTYAKAMAGTAAFTQVAENGFDRTQWAGQWFARATVPAVAGRFLPQARSFPDGPNVENIRLKGIGHSGLLKDETKFPLWHALTIRLTSDRESVAWLRKRIGLAEAR